MVETRISTTRSHNDIKAQVNQQLSPFYALNEATSLPLEAQSAVATTSRTASPPANPESNNETKTLPSVPDGDALLNLFKQAVPEALYNNLHLHQARPPTPAEIELGNYRNGLLLEYIDELAVESGIDINDFPALHDCVQALFSAFIVMSWPTKEDIENHGIGLFASGNHSLTSNICRSAGLNLPGLGIFDISFFAFLRNQSGKNPILNLPDPIRSFLQAFYYMQIKEAVLRGNRTILQLGVEVRESLKAGANTHRRPEFRQKLANLFYSTEIIDLPDITLTNRSLPCTTGEDPSSSTYAHQFQLAGLPGQDVANSSIILRGDSVANHQHSSLHDSLQQGTAFSLFLGITSSPTDNASESFRRTGMHAGKEGAYGDYYKKVKKISAQAAKSESKKSFADYKDENCLLAEYMRLHIMSEENRQYLFTSIWTLPIITSRPTEYYPHLNIIQRCLPLNFTFDDILIHLQSARIAVPELLTSMWNCKSKNTTARRKAGEMSAEELETRAKHNARQVTGRLRDKKKGGRKCFSCPAQGAGITWHYNGGPKADQTVCQRCYKNARHASITDVCYNALCGKKAKYFSGGPDQDQSACEACYRRDRKNAVTDVCFLEDCEGKAKYWNGGLEKDQPICGPCYERGRLATAKICYVKDCGNKARYKSGGPSKDQPICTTCYSRVTRQNKKQRMA